MDQWINDLDLILQVSSQIKNIKNPENFKGFLILNPSNHWTRLNPYPALRAPWHCENSHLDAKPKAPAIVVDEFFRDVGRLFFQRHIRWNGRFFQFWNVGGNGCSLLDQHGASYYVLKLSLKYRYHCINIIEMFMFHNILAWKPLMFLHCCTSALCDISFPPIRISLSCVHYRHNPSHKVSLRLVLSLGLKMDALTILPRFGFISKIHSSSSCTTFTCDARQSNQENYVKPSIFAWHGTLLCGERW